MYFHVTMGEEGWRLFTQIILKEFTNEILERNPPIFGKTSFSMSFLHAFALMCCIFKETPLLTTSKVSSLKMHLKEENECVNGKCKLHFKIHF